MRSLPPIVAKLENEIKPIALPCPEIDLIALASVVGNDLGKLKKLVRSDPALFVFGLSCYVTATGKAPSSFRQFVNWLDANLLESFVDQPEGWSKPPSLAVGWRQQLRRSLRKLVRARKNRELRKSLVSFLLASTELKKRDAKRWIRELVGKRMSVKPLCGADRENKILDAGLRRWEQLLPKTVEVEAIFRFRQAHDINELQFEARLLNEKLAAMKQLAYGASHEINNPLANISTRAQTLIAVEKDPERLHKLTVIYEQALRAHEMISDMMLFAHPPQIELASTDIRLMISKLVKELAADLEGSPASEMQLAQSPIELQVRIGPDIQDANVDATQICVALKALIRNSIEAIRSGGRPGKITIRVCHRTDQFWFMVTDDGVGVSSEAVRHLFDPFYSGREAGRGLGFGLSKAWRIAQLHGGNLRFDEGWADCNGESGKGSGLGARFILSLPTQQSLAPRINKASVA